MLPFSILSLFFNVISGPSFSHPVASSLAPLWHCFEPPPPTHLSLLQLLFNNPIWLPLFARPFLYQFCRSFLKRISGPSFSHPVASLLAPLWQCFQPCFPFAVERSDPRVAPKEKEQEGHSGFGSSFGLPHRDCSAADSLCCEEEGKDCLKDAASNHPAILKVWMHLNDATLNNGCMCVVPREFDTDFARTDNHHAHMNPATEVRAGLSSKIHFPLHGVRALPAPAGSLIAWHGNTIHWGPLACVMQKHRANRSP
jgi:hypothetical protein